MVILTGGLVDFDFDVRAVGALGVTGVSLVSAAPSWSADKLPVGAARAKSSRAADTARLKGETSDDSCRNEVRSEDVHLRAGREGYHHARKAILGGG